MSPEELSEFHQQWLQHPVTAQLKTLMRGREKHCIESIGKASFTGTDVELRNFGNQLRTIQAIIQLAFDTETFVNKVKEGKQ